MLDDGHINLVETLAERVAEICLVPDDARDVRVRVEKLDIVPDAAAVGVEIHRKRG
jgi:dihydroneopterin aldolase